MTSKASADMLAAELFRGHRAGFWEQQANGKDVRYNKEVLEGNIQRVLAGAFLPEGYPASVSADYTAFQVWDSIQAVCSYVRGILTSQAILAGVGVGQTAATPLSAVFQFFLRDFSGMLGGIVFAFVQGSTLDTYAKQYRLFADCLNNVGLALELMSPAFPSAFLVLACLGSIARAITGVAGGATRAALTQHFALQRNAADISAKEGSQETATTLLGMLLGMALTHSCAERPRFIWAAFLLLTVLHIYANIRAVRTLRLATLNRSRTDLLVTTYLDEDRIMSTAEVAGKETLAPPPIRKLLQLIGGRHQLEIRIGARLSDLAGGASHNLAKLTQYKEHKYIVRIYNKSCINIVLRSDATLVDKLKAYVQALKCLSCWRLLNLGNIHKGKAEADAAVWLDQHWDQFQQRLAAGGWNIDSVSLGEGPWQMAWGDALHGHQD